MLIFVSRSLVVLRPERRQEPSPQTATSRGNGVVIKLNQASTPVRCLSLVLRMSAGRDWYGRLLQRPDR